MARMTLHLCWYPTITHFGGLGVVFGNFNSKFEIGDPTFVWGDPPCSKIREVLVFVVFMLHVVQA